MYWFFNSNKYISKPILKYFVVVSFLWKKRDFIASLAYWNNVLRVQALKNTVCVRKQ